MNDLKKKYLKLFAGLLVINLLMKLWGVWNITSQDEYIEVIEALRVCSGHLNFDRWIKRVYLYILSLEYGLFFVVKLLLGQVHSPSDFAVQIVRDMEPLLIIARATSAVLGTLTLIAVYKIGQRIHSPLCGLVACLLLTFNPIVLEMSHYARVDATLSFLITFGMLFILGIYQSNGQFKSDYFLAGLFSGLAFQCKPQGIVLVVPFLICTLLLKDHEKNVFGKLISKASGYCLAGFFIGCVIGNPAIMFDFYSYIKHFITLGAAFTDPLNIEVYDSIGYVVYLFDFARQMGPLLFTMILFSLICSVAGDKKNEKYIILSFIIAFYLLLGASRYMISSSYMLPLYPFLYLLFAMVFIDFSSIIVMSNPKRLIIISLLFIFLCIPSVQKTFVFQRSLGGTNTRVLAKHWIEEHIPPNSRVLMDSGKTLNTFAPLIAENRESILRLINETRKDIEEDNVRKFSGLVSNQGLILFDMLLKSVPDVAFDITSTQRGLNLETIEYYRENEFDYIIVCESVESVFRTKDGKKRYPDSECFYKRVRNELTFLKSITPGKYNSGDYFYIYSFDEKYDDS
jgi:hypothetical protein